jgi:phosphoenolpyruvate synthase/pyruvate phosphate dikinase
MKDPDLRVPPGFTITTEACVQILADEKHRWPKELEEQVQVHLDETNSAERKVSFTNYA